MISNYREVSDKKELVEATNFAKSEKLTIFIIGGGSDILVSDKDFDGLVIKYTGDKIDLNGELLTAESGVNWDDLVKYSVSKNLQGIECLSGIPGNSGAAPIQNIGAYGQELKDVFVSLTAYDIENEKFVEFDANDCGFSYRESVFKKKENWQRFVITDLTLKLNNNAGPDIKYDSLKNYLTEKGIQNPTLEDVREAVLIIRKGKFEDPKEVGNAGSFFKNPIFTKKDADELLVKYPEIPLREQEGESFKGSAGWFIEKSGWKGKTYKGAGVSPRHALILINPEGKATADDLMELSGKIIEDVHGKFGVKLEREVQLINF